MTRERPPTGFVTLYEAIHKTTGASYNVIGVCMDYLPPARSRGTDETMKFTLHDPHWMEYGRGMNFRFFCKSRDKFPAIQSTGDVVILRNVTTRDIHGLTGLSNFGTSWTVLPGHSVIQSTDPDGRDITVIMAPDKKSKLPPPSAAELQYAKYIANHEDPANFRIPAQLPHVQSGSIVTRDESKPAKMSDGRDKAKLLKDLSLSTTEANKFSDGAPAYADLFGEVRRKYAGDYAKVEIFLTDYTTNPKLFNYVNEDRDGDKFSYIEHNKSWPGPWGRMSIKIFCWDAHGAYARTNVKEGMFVRIKNCRIKRDPNGVLLEGACNGDKDEPSKVNISICQPDEANEDKLFKEFLQRRRNYEKEAKDKGLLLGLNPGNAKRKRVDEEDTNKDAAQKLGNPKKLSKFKRKKNRRAKQLAAETDAADREQPGAAVQSNTYVRCNNVEVPIKSINNILDPDILKRQTAAGNEHYLPFQNCRYKAKIRVVDYFPNDLMDFSVPFQPSPYAALSDCEDEDCDVDLRTARSSAEETKWEWRFMLIVEDSTTKVPSTQPKPQMLLLVAGSDAEFLLREDACDLRRNKKELAKLKEKLFVLWGDLEERKIEAKEQGSTAVITSHSRPFECLIKEYGVPVDTDSADQSAIHGFQRMFRMWGTTI